MCVDLSKFAVHLQVDCIAAIESEATRWLFTGCQDVIVYWRVLDAHDLILKNLETPKIFDAIQ